MTIPFIGLKKQYNDLRTEILDATDIVLRSGNLMNGNSTAEFEYWLAKKNRVTHAITCHSGTHALEIMAAYYIKSLNHVPRVLIPTMTYAATVNAFMREGWEVTLIDCDAQGIMNLSRISGVVDFDLAVIVGLYGASIYDLIDMEWRYRFKNETWDLTPLVVEDAAQHWLSHNCDRIGTSAISFDPTKNLASYGNGGAVLTSDPNLAEYARGWRDNAKPAHDMVATNSRMSEVDCAQMLVKTRHIDRWQERRRSIARYWIDRFREVESMRTLITDTNIRDHGLQKFVIEVDSRDTLMQQLNLRKIETKIHYRYPLHEIGVYRDHCGGPDMLAAASGLARRCLSLPFYPELTDLEVEYIADRVVECVDANREQVLV